MSEADKYGPMRNKLETQIVGSKTTVSRGMSPYDIFSISVRVPYMYSVDLEYDVSVWFLEGRERKELGLGVMRAVVRVLHSG